MAEAILKYDLSNIDDQTEFKLATKANDMYNFLFQLLLNEKRNIEHELEEKAYNNEELSKYDVLDLVFDRIHELANENAISDLIE